MDLIEKPKLLIPDIKGEAQIVYEEGHFYPHHNLYYILAQEWNLKALQHVLLSGIAHFFVSVYSTKLRGGYLRYQAQHLRQIRLPKWSDVPVSLKNSLIALDASHVVARAKLVSELYGLNQEEQKIVNKRAQP